MCAWHRDRLKGESGISPTAKFCCWRREAALSISCSAWSVELWVSLWIPQWCLLATPQPGFRLRSEASSVPKFAEEGSIFACSLCAPFYLHRLSEIKLHWLDGKLLECGVTAHLGAWRSQMSCLPFACAWSTSIQILENNLNNSLMQY